MKTLFARMESDLTLEDLTVTWSAAEETSWDVVTAEEWLINTLLKFFVSVEY